MNKRKQAGWFLILAVIALVWIISPGWAEQPPGEPGTAMIAKISFYKADLMAVLQKIATECGYNVIIMPGVQGTVTLELSQITFQDALKLIIQTQGLAYQRDGRNFIIGKPGQLPSDTTTVANFHLKYADPKQTVELIKKVTKVTDVIADERTRTVVVTGSNDAINQAAKLVEDIDRKLTQITLEVKVVEVSTSALRKLSTEFQIDNTKLDWGVTSSGAELIVGMISNGHGWNTIFQSLFSDGKARLVTSPSIATVDGKEASILIGDKIPIITKETSGDTTTEIVNYLDVGVRLNFTPWLQQQDEVAIDLKTQVNSLGEKNDQGYYKIQAREMNSRVQVKIGETLFLGGLISQTERDSLAKIPLLSDIPLLGQLFRRSEKIKDDTELIVTITPRLNNSVSSK